jgi:hypothetical protein
VEDEAAPTSLSSLHSLSSFADPEEFLVFGSLAPKLKALPSAKLFLTNGSSLSFKLLFWMLALQEKGIKVSHLHVCCSLREKFYCLIALKD